MKRTTKNHNTFVLKLLWVPEASVRIWAVTGTFRILHKVLVHDPDLWCDCGCGFLERKETLILEALATMDSEIRQASFALERAANGPSGPPLLVKSRKPWPSRNATVMWRVPIRNAGNPIPISQQPSQYSMRSCPQLIVLRARPQVIGRTLSPDIARNDGQAQGFCGIWPIPALPKSNHLPLSV